MTGMRRFAEFDPASPEAGRASEYLDRLYPALFETAGIHPDRMDLSFRIFRSQAEFRLRCLSAHHPDHEDTRFDVMHLIHRGYGGEEHMWHAEETAAAWAWLERRRKALTQLGVPEGGMPLWSLRVQVFVRKAIELGMAREEDLQRVTRSWYVHPKSNEYTVPRSPAPDMIQIERLTLGQGAEIKTSEKGIVTIEVPGADLPETLVSGLAGRPVREVLGHPVLDDPRIVVKAVTRRKNTLVVRVAAPFEAPSPPAGANEEQREALMRPWADRGYLIDRTVGERIGRTRR